MIYILLFLLIALCTYLDIYTKLDNYKKYIYWIICIILILFAGTRYTTGHDWYEYTLRFDEVNTFSDMLKGSFNYGDLRMEWGYLFINTIVKSLGGSINEVFLIMAFATIVLIFKSCKYYTKYYFLAIALYMRYGYIQSNMMFVRQGICLAIFLYSIRFIYSRNLLKYSILIFISVLFHKSSIVLLPIYFIVNKKYSNKTIFIALVIAIMLAFIDWMKLITIFTPDYIDVYINSYIYSELWGRPVISLGLIEKILIISVAIKYREKLSEQFKYYNIFFNIYILSFISYYSLLQSYGLQQRITLYLNISGIILITYFIQMIKENKYKVIAYTIIIGIIGVYFLKSIEFFNPYSVYLPYKSYIPMYIKNLFRL